MKRKQTIVSIVIMLSIVLIDQWIKIYVKTHFVLRESYEVASWFYLSFIENNGMAYGMEFGSKLVLTLFRIVAVGGFLYYLFRKICKSEISWSLVVLLSMVIAGAIGNIIDCVFYGRWFTNSFGRVAQWADESAGLMPAGEWLQGRVVDMFYFPLIQFNWPDWVPRMGEIVSCMGMTFAWPDWLPCSDEPFLFFKPVFNFADASISVGMAILLVMYFVKNYLESKKEKNENC